MDKMRDDAIREAARNAAVDEYFKARPQLMWTLHDKRLAEAGFDRGWQAAQSVQYAEDHVISIAGAYESGIGHCNDNLCNPYKVGSAESFAYDYGKEFGKTRGIKQSVSVLGEVVAHQFYDNGKWHNFIDDRHYQNTVAAGYEVRALVVQPTTSVTAAELERLRSSPVRRMVRTEGD